MNRDYVVSLLNQNGIQIEEEKRMNNDLGVVLKTYEGCFPFLSPSACLDQFPAGVLRPHPQ